MIQEAELVLCSLSQGWLRLSSPLFVTLSSSEPAQPQLCLSKWAHWDVVQLPWLGPGIWQPQFKSNRMWVVEKWNISEGWNWEESILVQLCLGEIKIVNCRGRWAVGPGRAPGLCLSLGLCKDWKMICIRSRNSFWFLGEAVKLFSLLFLGVIKGTVGSQLFYFFFSLKILALPEVLSRAFGCD